MALLLLLSILLPLAGAVLVWPAARINKHAPRVVALFTALATLTAVGLVVWGFFQPDHQPEPGQRYAAWSTSWLGTDSLIDARLSVSLDGISLWLYALSALLMFTCVLVSWRAIDRYQALFYSMLLLLEVGCLGVFAAQDLLLFYVFFEFTLIPLFFLIGVWGSEQRRYAAMKFFVFTLTGSLLTFVGLLTLVFWAAGYIGAAAAWPPHAPFASLGETIEHQGDPPRKLVFDIPTLQRRLNGQYDHAILAEDTNRKDNRLDIIEAVNVPDVHKQKCRQAFDDAIIAAVDTNGDGKLSYVELVSPANKLDRKKMDRLYLSLFLLNHNTNWKDKYLAFGPLPFEFTNEDLNLEDWMAYPGEELDLEEWSLIAGNEEDAKALLRRLGLAVAKDKAADESEPQPTEYEYPPVSFPQLMRVGPKRIATETGFMLTRDDIAKLSPERLDFQGGWSFSADDLRQMDFSLQMWIFLALFIGFAIKVPLFPLHTWLPLAHVQAPTAGSVFLAGVLLKIGTYGFLRFNIPMLPDATAAAMPWLLWLSVAGIIYGALVALAQSDIKKLIAYSSVSHLGFCMLGLFALNPLGLEGSVLQMVNHGISTGALFAIVGMLYERYHTRRIADLGGLAYRMPTLAFFMVLFTMSSIGLPGLNGFVGEFLILLGMFQRGWQDAPAQFAVQYQVISVVAVAGVVLGAWYMLWLVQRVFFGKLREPSHGDANVRDLSGREVLALAPLAVLVVLIGVWPAPFMAPLEEPLQQSTAQARQVVEQEVAASRTEPAAKLADGRTNGPASNLSMETRRGE